VSYLQEGAGGIHRGFPQQLAGEVKVGLELDAGQTDTGRGGDQALGGGPGTERRHGPLILRLEVEWIAGGAGNHGAAGAPVEGHHRVAKGVEQVDGAAKRLTLEHQRKRRSRWRNKRRNNKRNKKRKEEEVDEQGGRGGTRS